MTTTTAQERPPLNERIRTARQRAGLSQERFAELLGTSRRHVMRWEKKVGATKPSPHYQRRIAEVTGEPEETFSDGDEEVD